MLGRSGHEERSHSDPNPRYFRLQVRQPNHETEAGIDQEGN